METFLSSSEQIRIERHEPPGAGPHPALLLVHGSGGAASYWLNQFAPKLAAFGVGVHAPHYFDKTGTARATAEMILDGQHFRAWLRALEDAVADLRARPTVDARRIGVLGISLGGYLAVALGIADPRLRLVIELSGGIPPGLGTPRLPGNTTQPWCCMAQRTKSYLSSKPINSSGFSPKVARAVKSRFCPTKITGFPPMPALSCF